MSYLAAFWATLHAPAGPVAPPPPGPLRELYFDDPDPFFTYLAEGPGTLSGWFHVNQDWPGGARNRTVSGASFVQPGQTLTLTTRRFYTTGLPDEGIAFYFATEGGGPLDVHLDGQFYTRLYGVSYYDSLQVYSYDMRRSGSQNPSLAQGNGAGTFYETPTFGEGWHTVTLVKVVNINEGNTDGGGRATYFDGATVYTRHPTFS